MVTIHQIFDVGVAGVTKYGILDMHKKEMAFFLLDFAYEW